MKVKLEKEYRKLYTLEDLDRAKEVIRFEKENDEDTAAGWAAYAIREALKDTGVYDHDEILTADAYTARNCRADDAYGQGTGNMDVWIEATAKTSEGFIEIGAYLSDIWQTGAVEYKHQMYIQRYKKVGA